MVRYPVRVPRKDYRGSKANIRLKVAERNRLAQRLEEHVNARIAESDEEVQIYLYYEIARDLNLPIDTVRKILFAVDGGDNGFTVVKAKKDVTSETWA